MPSFAELEAAGTRIGEIRVVIENIFDTANPKEDHTFFRWANALHITTRPGVVERALLFKTGEALSVRALEETERLLRGNRYLYDVQFRPVAVHDGVVDIDVVTRDTWSLDPGIGAGRSGGANTSSVHLQEHNLLGTGTSVGFGHNTSVDRTSNEFLFSNDRAFGTWTSLSYNHAVNSDGRKDTAAIVRPFYALDTRWAAGVTALSDDRIDSVYNAGNVVSQYRHRVKQGEVFGGWSQGLVDGWTNRYSLGLNLQDDAYALEPGQAPPNVLPTDQRQAGPFVRYQILEDRYDRQLNRNLIGRPEFFALGLASTVQLGWAAPGLGSTSAALLYAGQVSRGFEPLPEHTLIAAAAISGQFEDRQVLGQRLNVQAQYYLRQSPRWLFYASGSADTLTRPDPNDVLVLGGDNGLRGYPLRYQSGTHRALFTTEERFYTDLYVWQLFRIGGAAFFDVGRAWGAVENGGANTTNPGWLRDVGFGLRIESMRSAFGNVLHVDIAIPLDATPDIKKVQFLVKTKASF